MSERNQNNITIKPMENKEPKEIWIHQSDVKELNTYMLASNALIHSIIRGNMDNSEYIKYLSETHVKELIAEKEREIEALEKWKKMILQYDGEIINNLTKEIEQLKKQLEK